MSFVVYVNNPTSKAMVHKTACIRYIIRKNDVTQYGFWTTPFKTFKDAQDYAKGTGKKRVDTCSYCMK
jgi:hypothetical protein